MENLNTSPKQLTASVDSYKSAALKGESYLEGLTDRRVAPSVHAISALEEFNEPLPLAPSNPLDTIELLDRLGSPATVATAAGRYFGLVVGGTLPAALGARVLSSSWDQLVSNDATSPVGVALERVAADWLLKILDLPPASSVGYVTGATMANFVCLAAARHTLLEKQDWDVEKQGLFGAPKLHVVASAEIHVTVKKVLAMLGLGSENVQLVACDSNGSIIAEKLPELSSNSLVLTQAGNVNSGAFDPIAEICAVAKAAGAWVHVDGAFGLWAAASGQKKHLLRGFEQADSWAVDGHKWLNTPYECGMAICKHPRQVHAAMSTVAPYLEIGSDAAQKDMVPELSRSARGVEVWAALRSLGQTGVEDLVDRCCEHAAKMADELQKLGFTILNEVVLNQVVATYPAKENRMAELAELVSNSGEAWFGPTTWHGHEAFRISCSSWVTSDADIDRAIAAIKTEAVNIGLFE